MLLGFIAPIYKGVSEIIKRAVVQRGDIDDPDEDEDHHMPPEGRERTRNLQAGDAR